MPLTSERARLAPRLRHLRLRAQVLRAIRSFFESRGYLEVDTPQMVPCPGLELHLRAFRVVAGDEAWLSTSPEYQMKRLLAGGLERIFQIGHAFRDEERGPLHVREFTMLEWYRVGASLSDLMEETEALVAETARAVLGTTRLVSGSTREGLDTMRAGLDTTRIGSPSVERPRAAGAAGAKGAEGAEGAVLELEPPWHRIGLSEAFSRFAGVECTGLEDGATLAERARRAGWDVPLEVSDWDEAFARIFVDAVEPHLGRSRPSFLHGWPARCAALARLDPKDPAVAERFEVFAGGIELANAFCELTDAKEQRARLEEDRAARLERGLPAPPVDEKFLAALVEGLPGCSGIALGVDRLVMLISGAERIDEVLAFTTEEL